ISIFRFKMDTRKHVLDLEAFREMLHISPRIPSQSFAELPFEEEIMEFLRFLGHSTQIKTLTDVNVNKLYQPWRSFAAVINKCLTGKSFGIDSLRLSQAQILWGLYHTSNVDYAYLIWEDFVYQVEHKNQKKSNETYYPRFTKVIIDYFMTRKPSIPRRNRVNWHYVRDDVLFSTIKVVSRHQTTQQYDDDNNEEDQGLRIGEEEKMHEEKDAEELYRDVDINQERGLQDDDQEGPSTGSDRGSKRQREGGEHASASNLSEPATGSAGRSTTGSQSRQLSASESAFAEEPVQTTCQMEEPSHPVFETGHLKRLRIQDIEDMLLLLVQGKLSNLTVEERFAFKVSLRMFTRSIVIQRRMEDLQLGVESYQKRLNLTKPDTYRSDLKRREAYTAHSNPRGFIYQNKDKKNRLMRIDELHKFSDGTLNDVRNALDDRLKGIQI
nr:hypothetical protein [Tanacetum cinerariifolium]